MSLPESSQSGRRFELRRELGRGSYGVVHEAFDRQHGRVVALKALDDLSPESRRRFKREFRIVRGISHPNVAELYELTTSDDGWHMTMELVPGEDFASYARSHPEALGDLLLQLARGIRALHTHAVLHRDLKPSNVLVDGKGRVVVLDFGLATELQGHEARLTSPGVPRGTPAYMSPEQAHGQSITEASDWYAFGAMAYECMAGWAPHMPSSGEHVPPVSVLLAKVTRDAPALEPLAPDAPPQLVALVMELLAREPSRRPRGADVLARLGARAEDTLDATGARRRSQVFVGRSAELGALHQAYERLEEGRAAAVCVRGPFGWGKSTLLAQLKAQLDSDGEALVITGRCSPYETVPFRAFDGLIDELSAHDALLRRAATALGSEHVAALECVFPVLKGRLKRDGGRIDVPRGARGRSLAFAALRLLLCELAREKHVVMCIDDIHWADSDSAAAMRALNAGEAPLPVLIITTCELPLSATEGFAAEIDEAIRAGHVQEIALGPLSDEEAEQLMIALAVRADAETSQLARSAGGMPLLIRELARDVRTGRGTSLLPRANSRHPGLEQLLCSRMLAFDAEQRDVLQLLAISATALSVRQLQRALASKRDAQKLIDGLVAQGLVEQQAGSARLALPPMRDWVLAELDPAARRALHVRVAEGLLSDDQPAQAAALSYHYRQGERAELARSYASQAARKAASQLAFGQASKLYDDAIRLHGGDGEAARALRTELSAALVGGTQSDTSPVFLPACGDLVAGKYRIDDLLGRGGMGAVFSAMHVRTGKHVALKWLLPMGGESAGARFSREAQAAGRIHHANVVDMYDIGEHEGASFLVMELLRGEPLSARLERGPLSPPEALAIMLAVLQGVAAAHDEGVIHRDLKPHNIFLSHTDTGSPVPKVLDFGISKIGDSIDGSTSETITREGTILGTPQYMAPEQLRGLSDVDQRVDVYSLGVILYAMLTGALPFQGKSHNELVFQVATETPRPPQELRPEVSAELGRVVMRAMARNREDRFATVRELEEALTQVSLGARPVARQGSRRLAVVVAAVLAVVALVVSLAWPRQPEPPRTSADATKAQVTLPATREAAAPQPAPEAPAAPLVNPAPVQAEQPAPEADTPQGTRDRRLTSGPRRGQPASPEDEAREPPPPPPAEGATSTPATPAARSDRNRAGKISLDDF